jgi:hypothetical protein
MRNTAGNILTNALKAQTQHEQSWTRIQNYISSFPGFMQGPVRALLETYEKRVRASYQWQIDTATALARGADIAEATDNGIALTYNDLQGIDTGRHTQGGSSWVR